MFRGNKYDGNVYYVLARKHELSISVRINASETKGIMVISHKEYLSVLAKNISLCLAISLSNFTRNGVLSSLSLKFRPNLPLTHQSFQVGELVSKHRS